MTPLLQVQDLHYKRRHKRRFLQRPSQFELSGVSFDLMPGQTLAVIGDNGSGKSTLAKLLVGALEAQSGTILLKGRPIDTLGKRCQRIRMVFQHSRESLNPSLTVARILEEPLKLNTELTSAQRQQQIESTLRQVGLLSEHQHYYRHMLSDGQRQRVAIARALILKPDVIVADEPFAALDPSVRSQTVNLLLTLQQRLGLGFIFISHNLGIVRHMSDRVMVMQQGKVIEQGRTRTLFNWPKTEYTKRLIRSHQQLLQAV